MKALFYSTNSFERSYLEKAKQGHEALFITESLSLQTTSLAKGFDAVSIFTTDNAGTAVLQALHQEGVRYISIRATGYDNVDIQEANRLGIEVANVPALSAHAVAEHALCLLLALARKVVVANEQVQQHNFALDNLIGFNLHGKKVGVIGTGKVGSAVIKMLHNMGCTLLAYDTTRNPQLENRYNVYYMGLHTLCSMADIIMLHVPLTSETYHLINQSLFRKMKRGVTLINTSQGAVIDTEALLENLISGQVGAAGLDVYEHQRDIYFKDLSGKNLQDPLLLKLLSLRNVLLTPHQGFATKETLENTAATTFNNFTCWKNNQFCENQITYGLQKELSMNNKNIF